ncbi:hypothetical protein [Roseateles sp.]|uniref:hypothetical protein n=1 Tax=Roseateles sp. TaxID=1971397 RepID=UPI0031D15A20
MSTIDPGGWIKAGRHLPPEMRDFHDAKDLFKAIHERAEVDKMGGPGSIDPIAAQCYVMDVFLWFMARRGYTLQKSRAKLAFRDLAADVKESNAQRLARQFELMHAINKGPAND